MDFFPLASVFVGGILAGLYGSSVGSGGLVSLPVLLLTGLPVHIAIATNRFGAVLLELSSAFRFYREKKLNLRLGILFGVLAAIGSFVGSNILLKIDESYLRIITAILLVAVFFILIFKQKLGIKEIKTFKNKWYVAGILTVVLGIYGGISGAGFGTFISFVFVITGSTFVQSAGISRVVGFIMSFVATIVFAFHGVINYPLAISLGIGYAIGGWIGAGISIKKGNNFIRVLFIVILVVSVFKLLFGF